MTAAGTRPPALLLHQPAAPRAAPLGCIETGTALLLPAQPRFWCSIIQTRIAQGHYTHSSKFQTQTELLWQPRLIPPQPLCKARARLCYGESPTRCQPKIPAGCRAGSSVQPGPCLHRQQRTGTCMPDCLCRGGGIGLNCG